VLHSTGHREPLEPGVPVVFAITNGEERRALASLKLRNKGKMWGIQVREVDAFDHPYQRVRRCGKEVERTVSEYIRTRSEEAFGESHFIRPH
jgi:hypothetical protein